MLDLRKALLKRGLHQISRTTSKELLRRRKVGLNGQKSAHNKSLQCSAKDTDESVRSVSINCEARL